jgi:hypothetical protein
MSAPASAEHDAAVAVAALSASAAAASAAAAASSSNGKAPALAQTLVQGSASPAQIRAKLITKEPQIIKLMQRRMAEGKPFYSFEYFPPKVRARHSPRAAVLCPSVCLHARGSLSALISVFLCVLQTREGVTNLYSRLDRMDLLEPLFMDLTWGAGPSLLHADRQAGRQMHTRHRDGANRGPCNGHQTRILRVEKTGCSDVRALMHLLILCSLCVLLRLRGVFS